MKISSIAEHKVIIKHLMVELTELQKRHLVSDKKLRKLEERVIKLFCMYDKLYEEVKINKIE